MLWFRIAMLGVILVQVIMNLPVNPGPGPDPGPDPIDDAPFPADELTVLIVEETEDRDTIPASQLGILSSMDVRNASGGTFRLYDDDVTIQEQGPWKAALDAWRASGKPTPAIAISNGKTGIIDDLPQSIAATVELIGRFD